MHFSFDWSRDLQDVVKILIAYLLVLPVGWYREREAHSVGVRTFPVVSMASCGYVLLGAASAHMSGEAQSRIIQGLVAGIGFIGGGAILKSESRLMALPRRRASGIPVSSARRWRKTATSWPPFWPR